MRLMRIVAPSPSRSAHPARVPEEKHQLPRLTFSLFLKREATLAQAAASTLHSGRRPYSRARAPYRGLQTRREVRARRRSRARGRARWHRCSRVHARHFDLFAIDRGGGTAGLVGRRRYQRYQRCLLARQRTRGVSALYRMRSRGLIDVGQAERPVGLGQVRSFTPRRPGPLIAASWTDRDMCHPTLGPSDRPTCRPHAPRAARALPPTRVVAGGHARFAWFQRYAGARWLRSRCSRDESATARKAAMVSLWCECSTHIGCNIQPWRSPRANRLPAATPRSRTC